MGNSASALPYSIDSAVEYTTRDGWTVSKGVKKSDGTAVTVFVGKKPTLAQQHTLEPALHHFQHAKKLRHPMLLQVYATLDTDAPASSSSASDGDAGTSTAAAASSSVTLANQKGDYILVTEPCVPLETWLQATPRPSQEQVAWTLFCMVQALSFLHQSAALAHGNVSPDSWKVTPSGDVKLWNYTIITSNGSNSMRHFQQYEAQLTPNDYRSPERIDRNFRALESPCGIHSMDAYGLGILIQQVLFVYHGGVPATLQKSLQRLLNANPKARPRLQGLLKCPLFASSPYIQLQQSLSELQIQPVEQKIAFWQTQLFPRIGQVSASLALYKLLPLLQSSISTIASSDTLLKQDLYKREVLAMLPILFAIWDRFPERQTLDASGGGGGGGSTSTSLDFIPTIGLLMRIQDRAVRGALLQKMNLIVHEFVRQENGHALNAQVFEPMCSGFSDSSAALRELTLKSSLTLVPHLSPTNLEKLSRYLTRLQSDPEASIRTNSIVLIIKVIPHLTQVQQEKLFIPSLTRGLNDAFDPCRLACLNAIAIYDKFTPEMLAFKVIPIVSPKLVDGSQDVRNKSFQVMNKCLGILQEAHTNMIMMAAREQSSAGASSGVAVAQPQHAPPAVTAVAAAPSSSGSSGGYLSGLSSWMSSSTAAGASSDARGTGTSSQQPSLTALGTNANAAAAAVTHQPVPTTASTSSMTSSFAASTLNNTVAEDNDGWDDDDDDDDDNDGNNGWDDDDLLGPNVSSSTKTSMPMSKAAPHPAAMLNMEEEEDFFKSFDTKKVPLRSTGGKLAVPSSASKKKTVPPPKITKLKVDASDWDDF